MGCVSSRAVADETTESKANTGPDRKKILKKLNREVEKYIKDEHTSAHQKALFLGPGESGKSTVLKQMRFKYGAPYTAFERYQYSKLIWVDTVRAMRTLVDYTQEKGYPLSLRTDANLDMRRFGELLRSLDLTSRAFLDSQTNVDAKRFLGNMITGTMDNYSDPRTGRRLPEFEGVLGEISALLESNGPPPKDLDADRTTVANAVYRLYTECVSIKRAIDEVGYDFLDSNAGYFFENIVNTSHPSYLASDEDILRARIKTTGISETSFRIKNNYLTLVDVGGQRTERRKWMHVMDDVSCVIYVVAVSEYDMTLRESPATNRLGEALELFGQIVDTPQLQKCSVVLLLNKIDILEQKCHHVPFSSYFPGYQGNDDDSKAILGYIGSLFRGMMQLDGRELYIYNMCATDTEAMKFITGAITDMIFMENMRWAGII